MNKHYWVVDLSRPVNILSAYLTPVLFCKLLLVFFYPVGILHVWAWHLCLLALFSIKHDLLPWLTLTIGLFCFVHFFTFLCHIWIWTQILENSVQVSDLNLSFLNNRQLWVVLDGKSLQEYPIHDVTCNIAIYGYNTTPYSKYDPNLWQNLEFQGTTNGICCLLTCAEGTKFLPDICKKITAVHWCMPCKTFFCLPTKALIPCPMPLFIYSKCFALITAS